MAALARLVAWKRPLWCCGVTLAIACLLVAALDFLRPTDALLWPASVRGVTYRGERQLGVVALERRAGRWRGRVADFPPGTATHFQLSGAYGLYLIVPDDGRPRAFVDHGARYRQRLYRYDPLPLRPPDAPTVAGFRDVTHGSVYHADGSRLAGPVWRPLDLFPLDVLGEYFLGDDRADCRAALGPREAWCR